MKTNKRLSTAVGLFSLHGPLPSLPKPPIINLSSHGGVAAAREGEGGARGSMVNRDKLKPVIEKYKALQA